MKLFALYLLSSFAIASPQEASVELGWVLPPAFEEAAVAEALPADTRATSSNARTIQGRLAEPSRVLIGITGTQPSAALCSHLDLDADQSIIINSTIPGMSAARAGVREHDIIIAIGGDAGATMAKLRATLGKMEVGQVLALTVVRNGQRQVVAVPILENQERTAAAIRLRGPYQYEGEESLLKALYDQLALR